MHNWKCTYHQLTLFAPWDASAGWNHICARKETQEIQSQKYTEPLLYNLVYTHCTLVTIHTGAFYTRTREHSIHTAVCHVNPHKHLNVTTQCPALLTVSVKELTVVQWHWGLLTCVQWTRKRKLRASFLWMKGGEGRAALRNHHPGCWDEWELTPLHCGPGTLNCYWLMIYSMHVKGQGGWR